MYTMNLNTVFNGTEMAKMIAEDTGAPELRVRSYDREAFREGFTSRLLRSLLRR